MTSLFSYKHVCHDHSPQKLQNGRNNEKELHNTNTNDSAGNNADNVTLPTNRPFDVCTLLKIKRSRMSEWPGTHFPAFRSNLLRLSSHEFIPNVDEYLYENLKPDIYVLLLSRNQKIYATTRTALTLHTQ